MSEVKNGWSSCPRKIHIDRPSIKIDTHNKNILEIFQEIKNTPDEEIVAEHVRVFITPRIKEAMCRLDNNIIIEILNASDCEFKYYKTLADYINRTHAGNISAKVENRSLVIFWKF